MTTFAVLGLVLTSLASIDPATAMTDHGLESYPNLSRQSSRYTQRDRKHLLHFRLFFE